MTKVKFFGIDYWSRPVFKDIERERYYGSLEILFDDYATEDIVLQKVTETDLVYFGSTPDGDPYGDVVSNIEIVRGQNVQSKNT